MRNESALKSSRSILASSLSLLMLSSPALALPPATPTFQEASPNFRFKFPADHANHPDYKQEWWYFTGHLFTKEGKRYGYEVTFFRQAVHPSIGAKESDETLHMVHFAVTDDEKKKFFYRQKYDSAASGKVKISPPGQNLSLDHEGWSLKQLDGQFALKLDNPNYSINLLLTPQKPPAIHGANGFIQKLPCKGCSSQYYSYTNLKTEGVLSVGGAPSQVQGVTWMDHEFMSDPSLNKGLAWEWFSMQVDDGSELMLYRFPGKDGMPNKYSCGTLVNKDGTQEHISYNDFVAVPLGVWGSDSSNRNYITSWCIIIPRRKMAIFLSPDVKGQELNTTGVNYLEADSNAMVVYWGKNKNKVSKNSQFLSETLLASSMQNFTDFLSVLDSLFISPALAQGQGHSFSIPASQNQAILNSLGININNSLSHMSSQLQNYLTETRADGSTVSEVFSQAMAQMATTQTEVHTAMTYQEQRAVDKILDKVPLTAEDPLPIASKPDAPPDHSKVPAPTVAAASASLSSAMPANALALSADKGSCVCDGVDIKTGPMQTNIPSSSNLGPAGPATVIISKGKSVTLTASNGSSKSGVLLDAHINKERGNPKVVANVYFPGAKKNKGDDNKLSKITPEQKTQKTELSSTDPDSPIAKDIYRLEVPIGRKLAQNGKPEPGLEAGLVTIAKAPPVDLSVYKPAAAPADTSAIVSPLWPELKKLLADRSELKAQINSSKTIAELMREYGISNPAEKSFSLVAYNEDQNSDG
ncbi:MAG: hypothetical protein K2X27_25070, partial [Candidatus Obscuribacterales bacterium]|nr:hypothetical protein [Candidatus Obscuribacterales bacterium]